MTMWKESSATRNKTIRTREIEKEVGRWNHRFIAMLLFENCTDDMKNIYNKNFKELIEEYIRKLTIK